MEGSKSTFIWAWLRKIMVDKEAYFISQMQVDNHQIILNTSAIREKLTSEINLKSNRTNSTTKGEEEPTQKKLRQVE